MKLQYILQFLGCAVLLGYMFRPVKHPPKEEQGDE